MAVNRHSLALVSLRAGRPAKGPPPALRPVRLSLDLRQHRRAHPYLEPAGAITADLNDSSRAARLVGIADAARQESDMLIIDQEAAVLEEFLAPAPRHYRT